MIICKPAQDCAASNLKWNEQRCHYSCTSVYCTKSQFLWKPHWFCWVFFNQYLVDHGWHASYQCCGKVLSTYIKIPYSSEKKLTYCMQITVLIMYMPYSSIYIHKFVLNTYCINETNTSHNVSLFCCLSVNPFLFNTFRAAWFWRFSQKKQQFSVALPTPQLLCPLR